jgi:eukaryotic-like serine/threonine-protein kinase
MNSKPPSNRASPPQGPGNDGSPIARLGPYEVGPRIGRGGMADVYVARDLRTDANLRVVALKVVRADLVDEDGTYLELFRDEIAILTRLHHPNLIRVIDAGVGDSRQYIAMDLLLGRTLADVFDLLAEQGARMPPKLAAWICLQVAEGLHHAHELVDENGVSAELVHRDVNPSNIFLTFEGDVKLLDFGLARSRGGKTDAGLVKGKVAYLAPEQVSGEATDRRVDIFQLGISLWELLTGKRLFKRESHAASIHAIRDLAIPAPNEVARDIPRELSTVTARSLARDPAHRFDTMLGFARALEPQARGNKDFLADFMDQTFPGQRAELGAWYDAVTGKKTRSPTTHYPPAPVPSGRSVHPKARIPKPPRPPTSQAPKAHVQQALRSESTTTSAPPKPPPLPLTAARSIPAQKPRRRVSTWFVAVAIVVAIVGLAICQR